MKERMYRPMQMCCCCNSMHMMSYEQEVSIYIISKYKKREQNEKISIHNSIALRAAL